jgi:hypothetical protein
MDGTGSLPNAPTGLVQRISIIGGWTWIAMLALHFVHLSGSPPQATSP